MNSTFLPTNELATVADVQQFLQQLLICQSQTQVGKLVSNEIGAFSIVIIILRLPTSQVNKAYTVLRVALRLKPLPISLRQKR